MPSTQEAREARRRKILARGSDRLAFIAGELSSISSPSLYGDDVPFAPIARSGDAALVRLIDTSPSETHQESLEFASAESHQTASTMLIKSMHEESRALREGQNLLELEEVENLRSAQVNKDVQSTFLDGILDENGTGSTKEGRLATTVLTLGGIANSIDATEDFRASGALFLGVVSGVQQFVFGTDLECQLASNWGLPYPVAIVIVTDISLVFGALLLGLVRTPGRITRTDISEVGATLIQPCKISQMSAKLECCLEVGRVFLKTFRALFLDCSIYVVTLIGGYSLGQNWR